MRTVFYRASGAFIPLLLLCSAGLATTIAKLSFEDMTDTSEVIATGKVTRSWTAWDDAHRHIWTHYEIAVSDTSKGKVGATVEIAEPGGAVAGEGEMIAGTVEYRGGENVLVFLQRMPNGYLRTAGWGQGKFVVDQAGRLRGDVSLGEVAVIDVKTGARTARTSVKLEGVTLSDARAAILNRIRNRAAGRVQ